MPLSSPGGQEEGGDGDGQACPGAPVQGPEEAVPRGVHGGRPREEGDGHGLVEQGNGRVVDDLEHCCKMWIFY